MPRASRRRLLVTVGIALAIVVIAAGTGAMWSASRPKVYGARAAVQYSVGTDTNLNATDRALAAQAIAVRSRSVLLPVADATGVPIETLERDVHSNLITGSDVIQIDVHAPRADDASRILTSVVDHYVDLAGRHDDSAAQTYIGAQIAKIDARLGQIDSRLAELPAGSTSLEARQLATEQAILIDQRSKLTEANAQASIDQLTTSRVRVLTAPYNLADPVAPKPIRAAAIAGVVGLLIAAGVVYLLLRRPAVR
jgi:uncharacterized protein involved in exopolysaccharide biosynthesis